MYFILIKPIENGLSHTHRYAKFRNLPIIKARIIEVILHLSNETCFSECSLIFIECDCSTIVYVPVDDMTSGD